MLSLQTFPIVEEKRLGSNLSAGMLAAGTNMGNVALWKYTPSLHGRKKREGDELWVLQAPATVEGPIRKVEVSV